MSEEEKTLIFAKHYIKDNEGVFEFPKKELEILVNLIGKQNNRLEQLEEENKELKFRIRDNYISRGEYDKAKAIMTKELRYDYISKSVIREKIEELKEIHKEQDWTQKQSFYYDCYKELLGDEK